MAASRKRSQTKKKNSTTLRALSQPRAERKKRGGTVAKGRGTTKKKASQQKKNIAARNKKRKTSADRGMRSDVSWVAVPDPAAPDQSLHAAVPQRGASRDAAAVDEAAYGVQVLQDNNQLSRTRGALRPGETHAIEETDSGESRVVRKRFSAI
jgi:hypothetical protein